MTTKKFSIRLWRNLRQCRKDTDLITDQLSKICRAALNKRGSGWSFKVVNPDLKPSQSNDGSWHYTRTVEFIFDDVNRWPAIRKHLEKKGCCSGNFKSNPWTLEIEDGAALPEQFEEPQEDTPSSNGNGGSGAFASLQAENIDEKGWENQNFEIRHMQDSDGAENEAFEGLFGRNAHIRRILKSLKVARDSHFVQCYNSVLYGPPGCGKTTLLSKFGDFLGEAYVDYLTYDATTLTQAGALQELFELEAVPPVMFIEEIEKADDKCLRWLLGLLDERQTIQVNTARVRLRRELRILCLATVNDAKKFNRKLDGALASRFQNKLFCERPNREVLRKILLREIDELGGDPAWAEDTLRYCVDDPANAAFFKGDPRLIVPVCVQGGDDLEEYIEDLIATSPPADL